MASLLSGIGTLYLLFALVIISHAFQIGILIMVAALAAGVVLLARPAGAGVPDDAPARPDTELSPAEQLAVDLAEEPSERVPAQRAPVTAGTSTSTSTGTSTSTSTSTERVLEPAGR